MPHTHSHVGGVAYILSTVSASHTHSHVGGVAYILSTVSASHTLTCSWGGWVGESRIYAGDLPSARSISLLASE